MTGTPTADSGSLPGTALETIGNVLDKDYGRDAIHLATIAVTSEERLFPGQHVGLVGTQVVSAKAAETIGIVDPFLTTSVLPGAMFWLVLYPRTITSLRHVWTHPRFGEDNLVGAPSITGSPSAVQQSEAWLRKFTETHDCPSYDTLISALNGTWPPSDETESDYLGFLWGGHDGDSLHFSGVDAHSDIPPEFWDHVSIVLGRKIAGHERAKYFTCSC